MTGAVILHYHPHALDEVDGLLDQFVHVGVVLHERNVFAVDFHELLDEFGALQRFAEVEGLGGVEQLDAEDLLHVVDHQVALRGGVGTHTHVVFLALRRLDGVGGAGHREGLVLVHDGGGSVLRDHEAGVESGVLHEEGRQSALAANQLIDTAFGDVAEFRHGDGEEVQDQCQRLTVEVARADDDILVWEHRRVVGDGVDFGFHHVLHVLDSVFGRTVYLRHATEGVRILHVFLVLGDNLRTLKQLRDMGSRGDLSGVRAHEMHEHVEWLDAAVESLQGDGADDVGEPAELAGLHQQPDGVGAHELRAVEQRETLFGLQRDGLPAELLVDFRGGVFLVAVIDLTHADDGQREVRQRCQVAGSARVNLVDTQRDIRPCCRNPPVVGWCQAARRSGRMTATESSRAA